MGKCKVVAVLLVLVMVLGLAVGCSKTDSTPDESDEAQPSEAPDESEEPAQEAMKIAIILKTLANPYWVTMKDAIEAEAEAQGVMVDVFAMNSEDDLDGQVKKLEDVLMSDEYDAIGLAPITAVNLIQGVVMANEKGLPVVNIDEKFNMDELEAAGGWVIGYVTTDNIKVGENGASYIMANCDGGKVAIIEGKAGNVNGNARRDGAKTKFESDSNFEVVASQPADWDRTRAMDVATNIINANPDLVGIYCCNDGMALGAQQAVENAQKQDSILVVGTDGIDEAVESVNAGQLAATVAQDPGLIGVTSLTMLIDAVKNNDPGSIDEEPELVLIDSQLITKE